MIKIGIIGGTSFAAGELCRLLLNHPEAEIVFVNSESEAGRLLTDVHEGLYGETDLYFTDELPFDAVDVVFFCLAKGESTAFLHAHYIPADVRIIDLTPDFRMAADDNDYVYGLPELNRLQIMNALHVANPGCFATCIQLGLLPLAEAGFLRGEVMVNAICGATGAEVKPSRDTLTWLFMGNMCIDRAFDCDEVAEINQSLHLLQPDFAGEIDFLSYKADFARGVFTTLVTDCAASLEEVEAAFRDFYSEASFTHYVGRAIDLKQVINTNKCLIHAERHRGKLLVTVCIDNLLKGASGQAVQNMNLMFGLEENTGLMLKALGY